MQKFTTSLSVVVPCYNEGKTIYRNLLSIHRFLSDHFTTFEIIAVNDGSTDETKAEIQKAEASIPLRAIHSVENSGKGNAVRRGILSAKHDLIAFLDADLAIPIETLLDFVPKAENEGFDMVIASRFLPGLKVKKPVLWYRQVMERIFRCLRMLILQDFSIQDTQCGFKLFKRETALFIFSRTTINRFAFDSEVIFIALKKRYRILELSITLQNPTRSSIRIVRDSLNMVADLVRIRLNGLKGKYL